MPKKKVVTRVLKEKSFDEFDIDNATWRGQVVATLETISRDQAKMDKIMGDHCKQQQALLDRFLPEFNRQTETLAHVIKELPDKGFCGKLDKVYSDMYPENEDSLTERVNILWYDRKILKWVLATSMGASIVSGITLITGFLKGVF
jgi:hypothetical protein